MSDEMNKGRFETFLEQIPPEARRSVIEVMDIAYLVRAWMTDYKVPFTAAGRIFLWWDEGVGTGEVIAACRFR